MRKLWQALGMSGFWLLSPVLLVYLRLNARTRVVIVADGQILLVKPWLGTGRWDLPGGGLKLQESTRDGAVREVFEETGIELKPQSLKSLGMVKKPGLFPARIHCFSIKLEHPPAVKKQFVELIDIGWVKTGDMVKYSVNSYSQTCLDLWRKRS